MFRDHATDIVSVEKVLLFLYRPHAPVLPYNGSDMLGVFADRTSINGRFPSTQLNCGLVRCANFAGFESAVVPRNDPDPPNLVT
jgi:hypothetical protein